MNIIENFKKLTGETDDTIVSFFLNQAEETVLEKTNRSEMIDDLNHFKFDLAVARYNRNGEEGESSHSEGGVSKNYLSDEEILKGCEKYRLTPIARRILDAKKKAEEIQAQEG